MHLQQLELAKEHFYAWRMPEAYAILRRFFDRLPFDFQPAHALYLSIYLRVLLEMGKERELGFYRGVLEKRHSKCPEPWTAYALVVLYLWTEPKRSEVAKNLLDFCLARAESEDLQIRSKMFLASYYCSEKQDTASAQAILQSMDPPRDPFVSRMVQMWKANVLRHAGQLEAAEAQLRDLLESVDWESDWYAVFCAQTVLTLVLVEQSRFPEARALTEVMKARITPYKLRWSALQIETLEAKIENASNLGTCLLEEREEDYAFEYRYRRLRVPTETASGKLLLLFLKKRRVRKEEIIQAIYSRRYSGESDDSLIYYQIHSLRKQLMQKAGLPPEAILSSQGGYLWRPEVDCRSTGSAVLATQ